MSEEKVQSRRGFLKAGGLLGLGALTTTLAACSNADPFRNPEGAGDPSSIVIGSSVYYSSEIIAEIYAQRLEVADFIVKRESRIGQREIYMPEIVLRR